MLHKAGDFMSLLVISLQHQYVRQALADNIEVDGKPLKQN